MGNGKDKIIFFGTPEICIPFLESLKENFDLKLIVTQPDSFGGRKKKVIEPAAKIFAIKNNIPFIQPEKLNSKVAEEIRRTDPAISVVVSYGKFIPGKIFRIPTHNTINVHFSLLPEYRGAAPVQRTIEDGLNRTGITIFEINKGMDTGDIWAKKEYDIDPADTSKTLLDRLSREGSRFLIKILNKIISGNLEKTHQNNSDATYAEPVTKNEGRIIWDLPVKKIYNRFRAFFPWPGSFFFIGEKKFTVIEASVSPREYDGAPGDICSVKKEKMEVCCGGKSVLEIHSFIPQGKKEMTPYIFSLGNTIPEKLN
ncbi:MAG: methionyl-tRNA formyltransferase [Acidobacteriota bacterium]